MGRSVYLHKETGPRAVQKGSRGSYSSLRIGEAQTNVGFIGKDSFIKIVTSPEIGPHFFLGGLDLTLRQTKQLIDWHESTGGSPTLPKLYEEVMLIEEYIKTHNLCTKF